MKPLKPIARSVIAVVLILAIALFSVKVLTPKYTNVETYSSTISDLDDKRETVLRLMAASAATSTALTMLPDDIGTPIANKLVDFSSNFLIVLSAILLEKYLLTVIGYASFLILIPLGCVLLAAHVCTRQNFFAVAATKVILFGLALFCIIPTSVKVSQIIQSTYETSINETIQIAEGIKEEDLENSQSENKKWSFSGLITDAKDKISDTKELAEQLLNRFVEALSIMLVTTCAIPVLIVVFFLWLCKLLLGIDIPVPERRHHHHHKHHPHSES